MVDRGRTYRLFAVMLGLFGLVSTGAANATATCQGSYATALLEPLPPHIVIGLDIRDRSPRNLERSERFLTGLRNAGVSAGSQPNVLLHISSSRLGEVETWTNRGPVQSYSELPGLHGGLQPRLPALPSQGLATPRSPPPPPLLYIRIDAKVAGSPRIAWLATVQCQMTGLDEGQLSEDLGHLVGSTLGQRTERRPF
jgi:hypothetical protein